MPSPPSSALLFEPGERAFVEAAARLPFVNPFLPESPEAERDLRERLDPLIGGARERLAAGAAASDADRALYQDACLFVLYDRHEADLLACTNGSETGAGCYGAFAREHERLFRVPGAGLSPPSPGHLFACFFQIRRAVHYLSSTLRGGSRPAARLRGAVWESIFSCDMRRYMRSLFERMHDVPTLVTGATGTGKELVARAIGLCRYVPFDDAEQRFAGDHAADFHALNLSALSPSIVESEVFGHQRGAFTGAVTEKIGWLEACKPGGTVFLDEIGELDPAIQVKLLRVLEMRGFQRLGDTRERVFSGKIVAATHRDLYERIGAGAFRQDLYYRLCADRVVTPSLREQLDDAPEERRALVRHLSAGAAGAAEAEGLAGEVEAWIDANLPADYPWPGNVRELAQCVRNVMVRGSYSPLAKADEVDDFAGEMRKGTLSADAVLRRYATLVQAQTGNYGETAERLGIHRNSVVKRIDPVLLAKLTRRGQGQPGA